MCCISKALPYALYYIGFLGFAAYVLISYLTSHKAAERIFARDLEVKGKIIPCPVSWLRETIGFGLLALVAVALGLHYKEYTVIVFVAVVYLVIGALVVTDACKRMELQGEWILITVFRKEKRYLRSDIRAIQWQNCRGITLRQLVITFQDGKSYFFQMDHYQGVQNTYNELMEKTPCFFEDI